MKWFYAKNGQQLGPVEFSEIQRLYAAGELGSEDLVWQQGTANWVKLSAAVAPGVEMQTVSIPPAKKTDSLAIVSFVLGICALIFTCCSLGIFFGIPAVICGHISLSKIGNNPFLAGKGFAITGLILGYISILFGIYVIINLFFLGGMDEVMRQYKELQEQSLKQH